MCGYSPYIIVIISAVMIAVLALRGKRTKERGAITLSRLAKKEAGFLSSTRVR